MLDEINNSPHSRVMDSEVQDVSVKARIKRRPKAFAALLVVLFITTGVVVRPLTKRTTAVARNDEKKSVESSVGADDVTVASPKPFANSALSSTDFAPPPPSSAESRRQHPAAPSFRREPSTASKPLATRRTAAPAPRETAYDAPAFRDDVPSPQTLRDSSPPAGSASSSSSSSSSSKSSREVIHELLHEKLLVATANRDYASVVRIASKLSVTQPSSSSSSSSSSTSSPPSPLAEMPARKPDRAAPEPIAAHPELRPTASSPQPSKPATTTAAVPARARTRAAESATEMKRKATAAKRKAKVVAPKAKRAVSRAKKRSSSKTAPRSGDFIFSF